MKITSPVAAISLELDDSQSGNKPFSNKEFRQTMVRRSHSDRDVASSATVRANLPWKKEDVIDAFRREKVGTVCACIICLLVEFLDELFKRGEQSKEKRFQLSVLMIDVSRAFGSCVTDSEREVWWH